MLMDLIQQLIIILKKRMQAMNSRIPVCYFAGCMVKCLCRLHDNPIIIAFRWHIRKKRFHAAAKFNNMMRIQSLVKFQGLFPAIPHLIASEIFIIVKIHLFILLSISHINAFFS